MQWLHFSRIYFPFKTTGCDFSDPKFMGDINYQTFFTALAPDYFDNIFMGIIIRAKAFSMKVMSLMIMSDKKA